MRGDAGRAPYWLTRFVILRLLGLVYFIAFLSLAQQVLPLIGADGLLPARLFLDRVQTHFGSARAGFLQIPSLFWLDVSDGVLVTGAWVGTALSLVVVLGFANAVLLAVLWALYLSFVHIGQDWYGYGWEIQLLETGFLAVFLCPLLDGRPFPRRPPPVAVIWCFRWLIFRVMVGSGLIKLRGDPCWRNLTCLYYHYETQPIPNPLSRRLHFMPRWFHRAGVVFNHVAELGAPWFAFWPRLARHAAGVVLLAFQLFLIASGNLSFLNWLTIVPILACFDDTLLGRVLPRRLVARAAGGRRRAGRRRGRAERRAGAEPPLPAPGDEHLVQPARSGEHLRRLRQRRTGAARGRLRGHARRGARRRHALGAVRVQMQAGRSGAATMRHCAVSVSHRLADLVRGHVDGGPISLDAASALEAAAQRSGRAEPARGEPVSRRSAALDPRPALPLRVRAARRPDRRLVEAHSPRPLDPSALGRRPAAPPVPRDVRVELTACRCGTRV